MKVLVTGGAGFIGSHLVEALLEKEVEVYVIDNLSTGTISRTTPQVTFYCCDICSREAQEIISQVKPDVIFHLAAQASIPQSIEYPQIDANKNIIGTINILEACKKASVKKIIFSSTSGVYGNLEKPLITENDPTHPISFYGISKLTSEEYIKLFQKLYGISYTILRYSNVYGPGQTQKGEEGVIALFLAQINKESPIFIDGDGEQTRDFIYVKDVVGANLLAIDSGDQQTLQICTGRTTSINQLAKILQNLHSKKIQIIHHSKRPGDIRHSCLKNEMAYLHLQWQPKIDIDEGLKETYLSTTVN